MNAEVILENYKFNMSVFCLSVRQNSNSYIIFADENNSHRDKELTLRNGHWRCQGQLSRHGSVEGKVCRSDGSVIGYRVRSGQAAGGARNECCGVFQDYHQD